MLKRIKRIFKKKYILIDGSKIPLKEFRFCGSEFQNNQFFIKSSENEAIKILNNLKINNDITILDIGCGYGRIAIGLKRINKNIKYIGMDVHQKAINWCLKYLSNETYSFSRIDFENERYNKNGMKIDRNFQFKILDKTIDYIYLYSVFSHMTEEHMIIYLNDFKRILKENGKIHFTTFIEENVPNFEINPTNYLNQELSGPLHVVRYKKEYIFNLLNDLGFNIVNFSYGSEADNQSAIIASLK